MLSLAGALFAALVLAEAALRVPGYLGGLEAAGRTLSNADTILVLGDRHALSAHPGVSWADQLSLLLGRRFGGLALRVFSASGPRLNSAEALEEATALLAERKPAVLVLQLGQANFWNRHHLAAFLRARPGLAGFLSDLRLVRLFSSSPVSEEPDVPGAGGALDPQLFVEWARRDLVRLVRLARDRGAAVVLMTYPPERYSGGDPAANIAIRSVAASLGVPLCDVASELRRRWDGRALEMYYGPAPADDLNAEGNGLVAELLLEDLKRFGLLRP